MTETLQQSRPDEGTMRGVIPYLGFAGRAGESADFYAQAFGATDLGRMPDPEQPDRVMHVQIEINGGCLMMTDLNPDEGGLRGAHMQLVVRDGTAWWDRAIAAGCTIVEPYSRQFWGDDWGMVTDPFGIRWGILQPGPEA